MILILNSSLKKIWAIERCSAVRRERELDALPEELGLGLSTHVRQLTTICNSSSWGSNAFFWPLQAAALMCHIHIGINRNKL